MKALAKAIPVCVLVLGSGCATVGGTALSPITGGVDLTRYYVDDRGTAFFVPFVFIGGALSGPFVALWNGIGHDVTFLESERYWDDYPQVFRPFEMLDRGNVAGADGAP